MKKLMLVLLIAAMFAACSKDEEAVIPDIPTTGELRAVNNDNEPYNFYINGSPEGQIPGNSYRIFTLEAAEYALKASEIDFLIYPDVFESNVNIVAGSEKIWQFGSK